VSGDTFGLACKHCGWLAPSDMPMSVVQEQHFRAEHGTDEVTFELVILCDRCEKPMTHLATIGEEHHYECLPCHRGRIVKQAGLQMPEEPS
jgi:hypothetical protein